jgi:hypothetical protein
MVLAKMAVGAAAPSGNAVARSAGKGRPGEAPSERQGTSELEADMEAPPAQRRRELVVERKPHRGLPHESKAIAAKNRVISVTFGGANHQRTSLNRRSPMMSTGVLIALC